MRVMMQVLVAELLAFGTGSGGPKRQPSWKPVQVPVPQSLFARHGLPANATSPTQAGYSGFGSVPDVQVRMLPVLARLAAVRLNAPVVALHPVMLVIDVPMSGM